jgi:D-glycero-beta-D-manno-heptose-7-phosphate kinase
MKGYEMEGIGPQRIDALFEAFKGKRIAIIGDLMLDRYYWGRVGRISPEAPVPIVEVESEAARLGGAANVAHNIASLGGIPLMFGTIGCDDATAIFRKLAADAGFSTEGVLDDASRPTTCKIRVIAHHQHVVRIDRESRSDIDDSIASQILSSIERQIRSIDAIILQDYNKGVLTKSLIRQIIDLASQNRVMIAVDPKFDNFFEYTGVTVFKPNRKEAEEALGMRLNSVESIEAAGWAMLKRLNADKVLLTLGHEGMWLFQSSGEILRAPTKAWSVADVSGAGDTVISTLTIALSARATMKEAIALANHAAGVVCSKVGIVPIELASLRAAILDDRQVLAQSAI